MGGNPNLSSVLTLEQAEQMIWNDSLVEYSAGFSAEYFAKLLQIAGPRPFWVWAAGGLGKLPVGPPRLFWFLQEGKA